MTTWRTAEGSETRPERKVADLPDGTVYEDEDDDIYLKVDKEVYVYFNSFAGIAVRPTDTPDILDKCIVVRTFNIILEEVK